MHRFSVRLLAVALLVAAGLSLRIGGRVDAQTSPEQYVQSVTLTGSDAPGYRHAGSGFLPEFAQINALAAYGSRFNAEALTGTRVPGFVVWTVLFPTSNDASGAVTRLTRATRDTIGGYTLFRTPDRSTNVTGADEAAAYTWIGSFPDGRNYAGLGVAWRYGNVFGELFVFSQSELGRTAAIDAETEMFVLARRQTAKLGRTPRYEPQAGTAPATPPPAQPAPTPQPQPSAEPSPDMLLLVTAIVGGAIARDGTVIRAYVGDKECGSESVFFGWAFLGVASRDKTAGCGGDGATVSFRVGDQPAAESVTWSLDSFVRGVQLTTQGRSTSSGLLIRAVASINCRPPSGATSCSDLDRRLWEGSLRGWLAVFEARGEEATGEALLAAWARFRAERNEVLGNLVLAVLERRSYSFISAVRYAPGPDAPHPYLEVYTVGAGRQVSGWRVVTLDGGEHVFPEGTTLTQGACRLYLTAEGAASDGENVCGGAVLAGTSLARPGAAYLLDQNGEIIDSLGF